MRWVFFHGVFGDWGWEQVDNTGGVVAESRVCFESRADAEADAIKHGYPRPTCAAPPSTGATSAAPAASAEPDLESGRRYLEARSVSIV